MARELQNWIVNDNDSKETDDVLKYEPGKWCKILEGKAFISTIIAANTNPKDPDNKEAHGVVRIRIADAYDKTIFELEPGAPIYNASSDTFTNDSMVLEAKQSLQFTSDIPGMQLYVSGTGYRLRGKRGG